MPRPGSKAAMKEPAPRALSLEGFKCQKCQKVLHHTQMDFRQRVATCKGCASEHSEERVTGPWRMKNGEPRPIATLKL